MNNEFCLEFPSKPCNESFARMITAGFISELDPTYGELSEIKTAVSEAVTNAIIHGYKNKDGKIIFKGKLDGKTATFIIIDYGIGIKNIELAKKPLYTGAPEMERSGMGFTIMEAFTNSLIVESTPEKGTKITLIKTFGGGEVSNGG